MEPSATYTRTSSAQGRTGGPRRSAEVPMACHIAAWKRGPCQVYDLRGCGGSGAGAVGFAGHAMVMLCLYFFQLLKE